MKKIPILPIKTETEQPNIDFDDKHLKVLESLQKYNSPNRISQDKLTKVSIFPTNRKNTLLFLLFPEWAIYMPPYNLARLSAVTKAAGYNTFVKDVNIEAYHYLKRKKLDIDYWSPNYSWRWQGDNYFKYVHEELKPLLEQYFEIIEKNNITVLCITLYYCNQSLAEWFVAEAKRRYPHLKVIAGGPMAHLSFWKDSGNFDAIVSGEGEELILDVLEDIENDNEIKQWYKATENLRIDLDNLPEPWYDWCDFSKYQFSNGVCMEFSRGCTAKCTFCQETHFWKYRNRRSEVVVQELEKLYKNYNINVIWFLDSLVNGNIKELELFCELIVSKKIKIKWTGYARCDKRMDLDYFQKLKKSGCFALSYGIESGSDKILQDMGKGITCDIIESNLKLSKKVGIDAYTNWIIGFPTETINDFYATITLLLRQYKNISSIGQGMGFVETGETIVGQNFDRFNMAHSKWENAFITKDFKNSKIHRQIRMKQFVALMHMVDSGEGNYKDYFKIKFLQYLKNDVVDYEYFDFDIVRPNINPLADSFVNEIFALTRLIYRWRGAFIFNISFDKDRDLQAYGERLVCDLNGTIDFQIDKHGNYKIDYDLTLCQEEKSWSGHYLTHAHSVAAQRARRLAKNDYDDANLDLVGQKKQWVNDIVVPEMSKIDLSFVYKDSITGKW